MDPRSPMEALMGSIVALALVLCQQLDPNRLGGYAIVCAPCMRKLTGCRLTKTVVRVGAVMNRPTRSLYRLGFGLNSSVPLHEQLSTLSECLVLIQKAAKAQDAATREKEESVKNS